MDKDLCPLPESSQAPLLLQLEESSSKTKLILINRMQARHVEQGRLSSDSIVNSYLTARMATLARYLVPETSSWTIQWCLA